MEIGWEVGTGQGAGVMTGSNIKIVPGQWNVNTIWIIGMGVVVFVGNYFVSSYRLEELSSSLKNFQAVYATLDRVSAIQNEAARDAADLKSAMSSLGIRLESMQGMISGLDRASSQQGADITNMKDRLTELGRQGRNRGMTPEPKFTEVPPAPIR